MHIAFKCTYNDGGAGVSIGYKGTCSGETIKHNISSGRVFCGLRDGECYRYYDSGFKGAKPIDPCYESALFKDWIYGAGYSHTGREDKPFSMKSIKTGDLAILTTRFPGDEEIDRKIIGLFRIDRIENIPETTVYADKKIRIELPAEIARNLYFWNYYSISKNTCAWKSGLFRYVKDEVVSQLLRDMKSVLKEDDLKSLIDEVVRDSGDSLSYEVPAARGYRILKGGESLRSIVTRQRKYGPGGEGENHKKLKRWVAKNPEFLGLPRDCVVKVEEHTFITGDRPDIVFKSGDMTAIVEIETEYQEVGAHQALKYMALMCSERKLDLHAPQVKAFLVAWSIPPEIERLCTRYGIVCRTKKI